MRLKGKTNNYKQKREREIGEEDDDEGTAGDQPQKGVDAIPAAGEKAAIWSCRL